MISTSVKKRIKTVHRKVEIFMNHTKQEKGFTIIEVVLVLAIAALIFLMIFIALPALQRNQRDTARKNDVGVVISAVTNFTSNEKRSLTQNDTTRLRDYIDQLDQYETADVVVRQNAPANGNIDQIFVIPGSKCDGSDVVDGSSRSAAVLVALENNGSNTIDYCQDA